jgi:hypothetical protein
VFVSKDLFTVQFFLLNLVPDRYDITEILLKVALNTIALTCLSVSNTNMMSFNISCLMDASNIKRGLDGSNFIIKTHYPSNFIIGKKKMNQIQKKKLNCK